MEKNSLRKGSLMRITNIGLLIHGTGQQPARSQELIIEGSRLAWIGPREERHPKKGGCEQVVVDVQGRSVLPGFMDSHVHLHSPAAGSDPENDSRQHKYFDPTGVASLRMARNCQLALCSGITTLRDCGSRDGLARQIRDGVGLGLLAGPRILAAGRPITTTAGHDSLIGCRADTREELIDGVRTEIKAGSDFIKIMATGGFSTPGSNVLKPQYSGSMLQAAVDEAHRLGRRVAAHVYGAGGIRLCVEAGIDSLEHCLWLTEEDATYGTGYDEGIVAEMAARGLFLVTALGQAERLKRERARERGQASYERYLHEHSLHCQNLKRMLAAGVRLCVGTDAGAGAIRIDGIASTAADFVELLGLSPMEAIFTITRNPAQMMGIAERVGTLEQGKEADLVVVDGNPLSDIGALRRVWMVVRSGKIAAMAGACCLPMAPHGQGLPACLAVKAGKQAPGGGGR